MEYHKSLPSDWLSYSLAIDDRPLPSLQNDVDLTSKRRYPPTLNDVEKWSKTQIKPTLDYYVDLTSINDKKAQSESRRNNVGTTSNIDV